MSQQSVKSAIKPKTKPMISVKVYSPFKTYYNESAYSITALNQTGPFDVLPEHHNFISLLSPCELKIDRPGGLVRIKISRGIMHVRANHVAVFLDV